MKIIKTTGSIQISTRSYLSIQLIQSAALFSKLAARVETTCGEPRKSNRLSEHQSFVIGAIFTSAAFLEANINEIFKDCHDVYEHQNIMNLGPETIKMYGRMWKLKMSGNAPFSILEKYQIALTLAKKELFDEGALPYQDTKFLIKLRNALMHYEPESVIAVPGNISNNDSEQKLEKILKSKFPLNPLTGAGNAFFPNKCLSHGCSTWAIKSCLALTDEFFKRLDLNPTYEHVREMLWIK